MSSYMENDCVGCPQGCIRCGREDDYWVWECDKCVKTTTEYEDFIHEDGKDYCSDCYDKIYEEE